VEIADLESDFVETEGVTRGGYLFESGEDIANAGFDGLFCLRFEVVSLASLGARFARVDFGVASGLFPG
jgi:hypothetical protein